MTAPLDPSRALRKVGAFGRRMDRKIRQEQLERDLRERAAALNGEPDLLPPTHPGRQHRLEQPFGPPQPGYCHAMRCDELSAFIVQVKRINGEWTRGIDYCAPHALDFAARTSMEARVQPL
jgi:hypothetical protein